MTSKIVDVTERFKARIAKIAKEIEKGGKLRVGFLEGSTETRDGHAVSTAMVAAIQNFGAPKVGIPPRPFFDNCIRDNQNSWADMLAAELPANDYDVEKTFGRLGLVVQADLKQSISDIFSPPLSEVTLLLRQMRRDGGPNFVVTGTTVMEARARVAAGERASGVSTKPLIDSGQMQQAVDYEIVSE